MDKGQSAQLLELLDAFIPELVKELRKHAETLRSAPFDLFTEFTGKLCETAIERLFMAVGVGENEELDFECVTRMMNRIILGLNSALSPEYPYRVCLHVVKQNPQGLYFGSIQSESLRKAGLPLSLTFVPVVISRPTLEGPLENRLAGAEGLVRSVKFDLN